eukprot:353273-Chlamydomonas_euryale.AAC.1
MPLHTRCESTPVVPVHGADAVELLHTEHRAQVGGDLLERALLLVADDQKLYRLPDPPQLLPRIAHPLGARRRDPLLALPQAHAHVLAVGEGAAFAPQQQLVEQVDVDKRKKLLEERLHEWARHVRRLCRCQRRVHDGQDVRPRAHHRLLRARVVMRAAARRRLGRVDAVGEHRRDGALHVVAHEREDLLHKRVQLLLEQQRRVLGLYCAEASHAAAVDGRLIVRRRPAARAARGAKERVKHAARAALLGAAVRRLDVLVEQVQQRDGVAQPVRQRGVVFLAAVNLAADDPDDAVKEARALSLRTSEGGGGGGAGEQASAHQFRQQRSCSRQQPRPRRMVGHARNCDCRQREPHLSTAVPSQTRAWHRRRPLPPSPPPKPAPPGSSPGPPGSSPAHLERTPLQTAAEDDNGSDRPPPVVTQVGRERRQQPLLLLAALLSQRSCLFGLQRVGGRGRATRAGGRGRAT